MGWLTERDEPRNEARRKHPERQKEEMLRWLSFASKRESQGGSYRTFFERITFEPSLRENLLRRAELTRQDTFSLSRSENLALDLVPAVESGFAIAPSSLETIILTSTSSTRFFNSLLQLIRSTRFAHRSFKPHLPLNPIQRLVPRPNHLLRLPLDPIHAQQLYGKGEAKG